MTKVTSASSPTRRNSLIVGLFLSAYGIYNLLNGFAGDNLTGAAALLLGLGLFLGVAAESKAGEPIGRGFKVTSWAVLAVGVVLAAIDMFGLAS
jgi:hypothetical protein